MAEEYGKGQLATALPTCFTEECLEAAEALHALLERRDPRCLLLLIVPLLAGPLLLQSSHAIQQTPQDVVHCWIQLRGVGVDVVARIVRVDAESEGRTFGSLRQPLCHFGCRPCRAKES